MRNNATFVTKEQLKFLKEMDSWLAKEPWQSEVELQTAMEVRTMITKIETKGYYYEGEADLLNLMREEYIKHKKKQPKKTIMRKLIWKLYNENMISIEVANLLLDKHDE